MLKRILLVEDHPIVQLGLQQLIATRWPQAQVVCAASLQEALAALAQAPMDMALVDLHLPDAKGLESLTAIHRQRPDLKILVLSMSHEEAYAQRAFQIGAMGYLSKDRAPAELIQAMAHIADNGRYFTSSEAHRMAERLLGKAPLLPHEALSTQEYRVLIALAEGKRLKEIGALMNLSPKTITTYRARVLTKLEASNNAALVQYCLDHQLIK